MAGTAGSGGLGALGISGIAAAAVVAGGVVAYLTGVFGEAEAPQPAVQPTAVAPANGNEAPASSTQEAAQTPAPAPAPAQAGVQPEETAPAAAETEQVQQESPAESTSETAAVTEEAASVDDLAPAEETAAAPEAPAESDAAEAPVSAPAEEAAAPEETAAAAPVEEDTAAAEVPEALAEEESAAAAAEAEAEAEQAPEGTVAAGDAETAPAAEAETPAGQPAAAAAEASAPAAEEPGFVLPAPELDTVRFESDGSGLIAGRATPGAEVSILLDADVLDRFTVDGSGQFAAFVTAPPSENQRVLSLLASLDGQSVVSDASFILGATRVPVAVAAAETAPEPEAPAAENTAAGRPAAEAQQEAQAEADPETEAPAAVAVLRADSSGISLVQPGNGPGPAEKVALDTLSYTDEGNVDIAGRAQPEAILRVYLDNETVGDLNSGADGSWSASLRDIAPGSYTLRVDEITAQGIVLSRVETGFTREAPEVLAAAAPEGDPEAPQPLLRAITVRKGDSLWAISAKAYGDGRLYVRLFDANRNEIKDPDLIYPGQVFALPE